MSIRIPVRSDIDIRNAFDDVVQEISDLKKELARVRGLAAPQLPTTPTPTTNLDLAYIDPADMNSGNAGPGSVLTSDGAGNPSWAPPLGGLVTVGEAGEGGRSAAQQVLGVNGSLAVLSGLSADSVRCREFWTPAVGCTATRTTAFTPTGTPAAITFNSETWDPYGFHSTATNTSRLTIPAGYGGTYLFTFNALGDNSASAGQRVIYVYKNGGLLTYSLTFDKPAVANYVGFSVSIIIEALGVGDYIEIFGASNAVTPGTWFADSSNPMRFSCARLGG